MIGTRKDDDLFMYNVSAEQFVPEDHPLRRIRPIIGAKRIRKLARPLYSNTGRPSIPREQLSLALVAGYVQRTSLSMSPEPSEPRRGTSPKGSSRSCSTAPSNRTSRHRIVERPMHIGESGCEIAAVAINCPSEVARRSKSCSEKVMTTRDCGEFGDDSLNGRAGSAVDRHGAELQTPCDARYRIVTRCAP